MTLEPTFTTAEVAQMEKVSIQTVTLNCQQGKFPGAYKTAFPRGEWRIPESAVAAWRLRGKAPIPDDPYRIQPRNPRARNRVRKAI